MKPVGILLLCLTISGCSSLILRDDDTTGQTVAKVAARTILVIPTLIWSEVFIERAKNNEAAAAMQGAQVMYFGKVCEKEGYMAGSPENASCILVKQGQMAPVSAGSNVGVLMVPPTPRHSTTCFSSGSGRSVTCY